MVCLFISLSHYGGGGGGGGTCGNFCLGGGGGGGGRHHLVIVTGGAVRWARGIEGPPPNQKYQMGSPPDRKKIKPGTPRDAPGDESVHEGSLDRTPPPSPD